MNTSTLKISKEFIIYCLVGLVNTLVGISTAFVSLNVFMFNYAISTSLAYIVGIVVSFFLNKKFTFKNTDKSGMQFVKFFTTMLPAYIFSYWLGFKIGHFFAGFFDEVWYFAMTITSVPKDRLADNFAVLLSMVIYLFSGFAINKFLVFKNKN